MIRDTLLYIGILLIPFGCQTRQPALHTGDLLFQVGKNSQMAEAITAATGDSATLNYTHVGIVIAADRADSVLEATSGGVKMTALQDFLAHSARHKGLPAVTAMRLRDTTGVAAAVARARKSIGCPYDYSYRPDNGKYYCSELVYESFRAADSTPLFHAQPMRFRAEDGTMPPFWTDLFEKLGEPSPEGVPGTKPNDMARDPQLTETGYRFSE